MRDVRERLMIKINVDWLRDPDFNEKWYTRIVFIDNSYRVLDSWMDERDIQEISDKWSPLKYFEMLRFFSPAQARWLNDPQHKELEYRCRALKKRTPFDFP